MKKTIVLFLCLTLIGLCVVVRSAEAVSCTVPSGNDVTTGCVNLTGQNQTNDLTVYVKMVSNYTIVQNTTSPIVNEGSDNWIWYEHTIELNNTFADVQGVGFTSAVNITKLSYEPSKNMSLLDCYIHNQTKSNTTSYNTTLHMAATTIDDADGDGINECYFDLGLYNNITLDKNGTYTTNVTIGWRQRIYLTEGSTTRTTVDVAGSSKCYETSYSVLMNNMTITTSPTFKATLDNLVDKVEKDGELTSDEEQWNDDTIEILWGITPLGTGPTSTNWVKADESVTFGIGTKIENDTSYPVTIRACVDSEPAEVVTAPAVSIFGLTQAQGNAILGVFIIISLSIIGFYYATKPK